MRVIIAGTRSIKDYAKIKSFIEQSDFEITEVVSGRAEGVDLAGEKWANEKGIPIKPFPVTKQDREMFGKNMAPKIRNSNMAHYADALIAIWDGSSGGTKDMIDKMITAGKPRKIFITGL